MREISECGQNVKERWWGKNHHLKKEKVAFLFAPVIDIQMLLLKSPLFIHPLSIFYSVFSQCLPSHHHPPSFFSTHQFHSLVSLFFLVHNTASHQFPNWIPRPSFSVSHLGASRQEPKLAATSTEGHGQKLCTRSSTVIFGC